MILRRFVWAGAAALLSCAALAAPARLALLPDASDVVSIKLAYMALHTTSYAPITEERLSRLCTYETEPGSGQPGPFLELLKEGIEIASRGEESLELRTAVYLQLRDGSTQRLLISNGGGVRPGFYGTMDNAQQGTKSYLLTNGVMLTELRRWARQNMRATHHHSDVSGLCTV